MNIRNIQNHFKMCGCKSQLSMQEQSYFCGLEIQLQLLTFDCDRQIDIKFYGNMFKI